jgi:hypothetical protein
LRQEHIDFVDVLGDIADVVGQLVDAVEGVEHRSQRPADRNVKAMRFPVGVVADRSEEVVQVGDVVA